MQLARKIFFPAILARRRWLRRDLEPKIEVYNHLCKVLKNEPIIHVDEFDADFAIDQRSTLFRRIVTQGHYEPALVDCCKAHIDSEKDIIDVGANIGFYSIFFAKCISSSRKVLAVEPTNSSFSKLMKNIELNSVSERVIPFKGVASDSVGELEINIVPGKEEYSSINALQHPSIVQEKSISYTVESLTLDALVEKYDLNPGFVKVDVEGAENLVFKGADNLLKNHRPVILSEITDYMLKENDSSARAVVELIRSYNYKVINPLAPNKKLEDSSYQDILCLPQ